MFSWSQNDSFGQNNISPGCHWEISLQAQMIFSAFLANLLPLEYPYAFFEWMETKSCLLTINEITGICDCMYIKKERSTEDLKPMEKLEQMCAIRNSKCCTNCFSSFLKKSIPTFILSGMQNSLRYYSFLANNLLFSLFHFRKRI